MALNSSMLSLPGTHVGIVRDSALDSGLLGKLVAEKPTLFGPVSGATFSGVPTANIVGESEAKTGVDPYSLTPWKAEPVKLEIGVRTSHEFMWADDDYRLGVMSDLVAPTFGASIGRAVDLFTIHGVNPRTGTVSAKATSYLAQATKTVEAGAAPTSELTEAVGLIAQTATLPGGIAMDPGYNFGLASEVYPAGHSLAGQPIYPQMDFGGVEAWRGLQVASSSTVAGLPELPTDSGIKAVVGDWTQVRWGFQRNFPIELIEYGDPDNTGRDLKGHNEVFLRSEAVIYVAIGSLDKFALVKDAA